VSSVDVKRGPGRPPGGPEQAAATKARIVAAATELFAEHGFHGTGVAEIGAVAGVQRGALYYHIGSKEELLFEVLRSHVEEALAEAERIAASSLPPVEKLRALIAAHVLTIARRRAEVAIYIRDQDTLIGDRAAQLQRLRNRVEDAWLTVLTAGAASGAFVTADRVIVNGLLGLVNMVYLWYQPDGPDSPEQIAEKFTQMVINGLKPRRAA
jgi:TetR/AcrR family transcriptional regulator, cholesterol catabolism regulator